MAAKLCLRCHELGLQATKDYVPTVFLTVNDWLSHQQQATGKARKCGQRKPGIASLADLFQEEHLPPVIRVEYRAVRPCFQFSVV
jgi:hypothetical protein